MSDFFKTCLQGSCVYVSVRSIGFDVCEAHVPKHVTAGCDEEIVHPQMKIYSVFPNLC